MLCQKVCLVALEKMSPGHKIYNYPDYNCNVGCFANKQCQEPPEKQPWGSISRNFQVFWVGIGWDPNSAKKLLLFFFSHALRQNPAFSSQKFNGISVMHNLSQPHQRHERSSRLQSHHRPMWPLDHSPPGTLQRHHPWLQSAERSFQTKGCTLEDWHGSPENTGKALNFWRVYQLYHPSLPPSHHSLNCACTARLSPPRWASPHVTTVLLLKHAKAEAVATKWAGWAKAVKVSPWQTSVFSAEIPGTAPSHPDYSHVRSPWSMGMVREPGSGVPFPYHLNSRPSHGLPPPLK